MDDYDDYPVTPRSDEELEDIADAIRKRLDMSDVEILTARQILGRLTDKFGVEIVVRSDAEMGRKEAYTTSNPSRIFFSESTFRAVEANEPRGLMTVGHEAFHFFVHPGAPKARAADGNKTPNFIRPPESAERQARVGAAAFLMPRTILRSVGSTGELQLKCKVSKEAAEIRFTRWRRGRTARPELPFVRDHINQLKSLSRQRGRDVAFAKQERARALWKTLEPIVGKDPKFYRLCTERKFMVAWLEFEKLSECGWFIRDNKVVASIALDRD